MNASPPNVLKIVIQACRLPFLILAPVSVFLGWAMAEYHQQQVSYLALHLAFVGGILAHISVNTFNEYFDFTSGLDAKTKRTPFSGGSGALVTELSAGQAKHAAKYVLTTAIGTAFITFLIGVYFASILGSSIIPIGLLGLFIIVSYTRVLNKLPFACWLSPGVAFGPLMVVGTYFVVASTFNLHALYVSFVLMLLANNLLLLNQFPDVDADKWAGRYHIPIAYGLVFSAHLYGITVVATLVLIAVLNYIAVLPTLSLLALLPQSLALLIYVKAVSFAKRQAHQDYKANNLESSYSDDMAKLMPYLGMNVAVSLITPLVLGITVMLA